RAHSYRARSASKKGTWPTPALALFVLNRNIEDIPLPVDQQEGKIGWLNRIGQALKRSEVENWLPIEFKHNVTGLEAGGLGQTTFLNISHHHPAGDWQIHLPGQGRS